MSVSRKAVVSECHEVFCVLNMNVASGIIENVQKQQQSKIVQKNRWVLTKTKLKCHPKSTTMNNGWSSQLFIKWYFVCHIHTFLGLSLSLYLSISLSHEPPMDSFVFVIIKNVVIVMWERKREREIFF